MKLLREHYKTEDGARKRAAFENGIARSEWERGYKARMYHYTVIFEDDCYRVRREQVGRRIGNFAHL